MGIALGLEWLLEDQVAIDMIRYHNVLVARACSDWEAARVICESLLKSTTVRWRSFEGTTGVAGSMTGLGSPVGVRGARGRVERTF